jgi:uncharacterized protein
MRILMTGATGLIGKALAGALSSEGHEIVALTRRPETASGLSASRVVEWDPLTGPIDPEVLEALDAVVNLAGEPIADRRWTAEQKHRIIDSRLITTRNLVESLRTVRPRPAVLVSGSAVGYYGSRGDEELDESSPPAGGFMGDLCLQWEKEADRAADLAMRVIRVRTGVVLTPEGGALKKMLPAFRLGVAGRLGSGRQWFPWVHIDDIVGIFRHSILTSTIEGPINGSAPGIVTNAEFTRELGRVLNRPTLFPVPEFALRLLMGEMADVLLGSQRVLPKAALASGYAFRYPELGPALENLLA